MAEAALGIAPGNPPILYAKAAPVVVSGGIGVKVPLNIGNTHETSRCNMAKSICDARITEGWRIGTRIESSRCVVCGQANFDFSKTLRDQYVGEAWSVMTTLAMARARFLSEFLITALIGV